MSSSKTAKNILMIVGDFVEDYEAMVPFQALAMAGHHVLAVCPGKRAGDWVDTAVHDFEGFQTYTEKRGHRFLLNGDFSGARPEDFDALYLPGGRAPEYLRMKEEVLTLIRAFFQAGKPVACICHGGQFLSAAGVLAGRRVTFYPDIRPEVELAGATWVDVPMDTAVVDGNLVSGGAWPTHPDFLARFLALLAAA